MSNEDLYKESDELRLMADVKLRESGYDPYTDEDRRNGIWTMTDAEFQEELRKAREVAWDDGMITGVSHFGQMQAPPNPHGRG